MSQATQIAPDVYFLSGAVNTGLLVAEGHGLLINCYDTVTPQGWIWARAHSSPTIRVPARTDGLTGPFCARPDGVARVRLEIASDVHPGEYVVPFRITWDRRYLGQIHHTIVNVSED